MDDSAIEKKIAEYEQQAELMFANYHRLKGAAIALKELLDGLPAKAEETALAVAKNTDGNNH